MDSHYANPGFAFCESMRIQIFLDPHWIRRFQYCGSKKSGSAKMRIQKICIRKNSDPKNAGSAKMRIQQILDSLDPQKCGSRIRWIRILDPHANPGFAVFWIRWIRRCRSMNPPITENIIQITCEKPQGVGFIFWLASSEICGKKPHPLGAFHEEPLYPGI